MHVVLIIVAANAVLIGFGCLIAGWGSLIGADQTELAELKQGMDLARQKSRIEALRFAWKWRFQYPSFSRLAAHWGRASARPLFDRDRILISWPCRGSRLFPRGVCQCLA
jgi:heme/copper-type cytochrome/quinol oxidase subunit 2